MLKIQTNIGAKTIKIQINESNRKEYSNRPTRRGHKI